MTLEQIDKILALVTDEMRNRHKYPANWEEISLKIRHASNWTCQRCGKPCRQTGETVQEFLARSPNLPVLEVRSHSIRWCLTVAHLNHDPSDCREENLMAMCAPCHLKYDAGQHLYSRRANQATRLEQCGQLKLF